MKRITRILAVLLLVAPIAAEAGKGRGGRSDGCSLSQQLTELPARNVGNREEKDLVFMREEEKLARDVYLTLYEQWQLQIFRRIARAESRHMALTRVVLDKYGLEDPVGESGLGVFANADLQVLYEQLTASGLASIEGALLVGAAIEDLDISDLQRALERSNNQDLDMLYQNLMKGSRNHMRAFSGALDRRGVEYEPVYLSAEEYREILDTPREKGIVDAEGEALCGGRRW